MEKNDNWIKRELNWNEYPIGTKAKAIMGGHWFKTQLGWKWNGPDGSGGSFPTPGGDNAGEVCLPIYVNSKNVKQNLIVFDGKNIGKIIDCRDLHNVHIIYNTENGGWSELYCVDENCKDNELYSKIIII